ncbi:kinase-like protein [Rickenella mellea]|uniref:non-specific serine/threonine protein kinase n=1 Tax=Rickenella mellea TaxID=50990 RepID=A0A4Y7Q4B2_9AGAM|nr:kinase-like protein [Rickenella mellea]
MTGMRAARTIQAVVGAEYPGKYRDQGFHPVHLGDTFANGRYTVRHKLGYGATSTNWLVHDSITRKYASLKIVDATHSPGSQLNVLKHLQSTFDANEEGSQYVMEMLDHFVHVGPNGKHLCIVAEVLGLKLTTDIGELWYNEVFPPEVAKRLVGQVALGVRYLHRRNVAHGDLYQSNILLYSPRIASWSEEDVKKYLGKPVKDFLQSVDGTPLEDDPSRPKYLVPLPEKSSFLRLCFEHPHVKICDFSEAFIPTIPHPRKLATPRLFRPPEGLLGILPHATLETDIWALAVLMHAIFTGGCGLFLDGRDDRILREMVLLLGKLPEPWWSLWAKRSEVFDEEGKLLSTHVKETSSSGMFLKVSIGDSEERRNFEELLRSMVRYEPHRRITAEDVVKSHWFVKYCRIVL